MKYPQGKLVRGMREYCGLTLAQLSKRTGLSITALSKVERGESKIVSRKYLDIIFGELSKAVDEKAAREKALATQLQRIAERDYSENSFVTSFVEAIRKARKEWNEFLANAEKDLAEERESSEKEKVSK